MASRFLGELVTGQAVGHIVLAGTGALAGLGVVAAVRAAQVVYGPLNTVHQGIYLALVPEGARTAGPAHLRRLMVRATVVIVAVAALWMLVALLVPDAWGRALFGDTWAEASDVLLLMGLAVVAGSAITGGFAGVRALGAARESLRARLRTVGPQFVLPLTGAAIGAAGGYAAGFGLGNLAAAVVWWTTFARALSSHRRDAGGEPTVPPLAPAAQA
jgi:O-antigen/teichoic acid export membrane protein